MLKEAEDWRCTYEGCRWRSLCMGILMPLSIALELNEKQKLENCAKLI